MESKDFKCLHRRKEPVSKTLLLRKGENLGTRWREARFAFPVLDSHHWHLGPELGREVLQGMFPHLSSCPFIHVPLAEHPSCEVTATWSCVIIRVWMQEEKMLGVILDSCEFVTKTFAFFWEDKITDKSYPDPSCTYVLLGKVNILISTRHIYAIWLAGGGGGGHTALCSGEKMGEGAEVLSMSLINCLLVNRKIN